jgi:hypothetical protein
MAVWPHTPSCTCRAVDDHGAEEQADLGGRCDDYSIMRLPADLLVEQLQVPRDPAQREPVALSPAAQRWT